MNKKVGIIDSLVYFFNKNNVINKILREEKIIKKARQQRKLGEKIKFDLDKIKPTHEPTKTIR